MSVLNNHWGLPLACALVLCIAGGCVNPEQRALTEQRARERTEQTRIRIPSEPAHLQQQYAHPPYGARHAFRWTPYDNRWQLTFVDRHTHYTGFRVRRPIALPPQREGMELYLELQPFESARSLAIGLADGPATDPAGIPVVPLTLHRVQRRGEQAFHAYSIPLGAFDSRAIRVTENGTRQTVPQRLNWNTIQGIHLVWLDRENPVPRRITIMNLQFAPVTWTRGLQIEDEP